MATTADTLIVEANDAYTDAKTLADNALQSTDRAINEAIDVVSGLRVDWQTAYVNPADVVPNAITPPTLPAGDFSTDVRTAFDYAFGTLNDAVQPQVLNYLETFFPDIAEAVKTGSDDWIVGTMADGRFVPIEVENAIWNRARDREVQEARRAEESIVEASAARGFSAPPGVMLAAVSSTRQELAMKLTTINREITVKAFDTANENSKFAVEQAVRLRTAFVGALGDFIKTAMVQPNQAVDYANTILAAKTGLYDSAVGLYRANIEQERMRATVSLENKGMDMKATTDWVSGRAEATGLQIEAAKVRADAAMAAADTLSKIASAAMATRNSMISVSAGV